MPVTGISDALGVEFKNPGLKERAKLDEKVARKGYNGPRQLTDIARWLRRDKPVGDTVAGALAARFDIVDEGWKRLPSGYIDRKVVIRHDDGMLSEIQIWTQAMWAAKKKGTPFYDISRDTGRPSAERTTQFHEQTKIYSAATEGFAADEFGAGGMAGVPNLRLKAAKDASSAKVPADDRTSLASTGQSAPGSSMASADMGTPSSLVKRTAGRRSQSRSSVFMGEILLLRTILTWGRSARKSTRCAIGSATSLSRSTKTARRSRSPIFLTTSRPTKTSPRS